MAFEPPTDVTKDAFQVAWLKVAEQPEGPDAIDWLAETLTRKVPSDSHWRYRWGAGGTQQRYLTHKFGGYLARLAAIRPQLPTQPALVDALVQFIERAPVRVGGAWEAGAIYGPVLAELSNHGDGHVRHRLEDLRDRPRARSNSVRMYLTDKLPGVIGALPVIPRPDTPAPKPNPTADELLAAIYADPSDMALRHIYADVMLEAGDPHGEFVALQLEDTKASNRKARKLLKEHRWQWIGTDLERAFSSMVFTNGFLSEATLAQNAAVDTEGWKRCYVHPALGTLQRISKGRCNERHLLAFLTSPTAHNLLDVDIPRSGVLESLVSRRRAWSFEAIRLGPVAPSWLKKLTPAKFPHLVELTLTSRRASSRDLRRDLDAAGLLRRLRRFRLQHDWKTAIDGASILRWHEDLDLDEIGIGSRAEGCTVVRDGDEVHGIACGWNALNPAPLISVLPPGSRIVLQRIPSHGTKEVIARIRERAETAGLALELL